MAWSASASPQGMARIAAAFYVLTFATGIYALVVRGPSGAAAGLVAAVCYVVVTLLFYLLFKPVSKTLSLVAALISLAGIAVGPMQIQAVHPLVFFGFYCLFIGYLVYRSSFLPSWLGPLMAFASVGWLTFLSPGLASALYPYNLAPGIIGEGALTIWLLVFGVNARQWRQRAAEAHA